MYSSEERQRRSGYAAAKYYIPKLEEMKLPFYQTPVQKTNETRRLRMKVRGIETTKKGAGKQAARRKKTKR